MTNSHDQLLATVIAIVVFGSMLAIGGVSSVLAANTTSFQVSNLNAPASVTQGETMTVNATITNTGNVTGNTTVKYRFNGTERANTTVELDAGNTTNVSFTFDTTGVATGSYSHGVYTGDDNQTATIDITAQPASFSVSGLDAPASVTKGESITVNATITNTGGSTGNTTVAYRFNGSERSNTTVELDAGNATNVSFTFDTTGVETGSYTHGVFTDDDNQTASIDVTAQSATFAVSNLNAPASVTQGESIAVNATITNDGGAAGTATVEYRFNGTTHSNTTVSLDSGNSTNVSFTFNTSGVGTGSYTHGVFTGDDNQTATITIKAAGGGNNGKVGPGPKQGPPPADMAAWKNTKPVPGKQTTPSNLGGKIRVETTYRSATSIELVKNTSTEYTLNITITQNATNVTFFLQKQAVESSQNISNVTMYLDGQEHVFYDESAGPGNSPWLLFEIGHFSTRQVSFQSTTTNDTGSGNQTSDGGDLSQRERALQIAGKNSAADLTQSDVTAAITRFNRGQSANGLTVAQDDVTSLITLFERNN